MTGEDSVGGCQHIDFTAKVDVNRIVEEDGVTLKAIDATIAIFCADCLTPMCFIGVDRLGLDPNHITVSPDFTELRVPIVPKGERLPGMDIGYSINFVPIHRRQTDA